MNIWAVQRQTIEAELRKAIERNEFVLHYQPKIDLESGKVTGAEALVRWQHPQRGMIFPASFIPVAEDSGLIVTIGRIVLREACQQIKAWLNEGLEAFVVSVNVSALEFRDKSFVQNVRQVLLESALEPGYLQLELTESVLMRNVDTSISILHELKQIGVQLAVDDFGTGYSSLSYLSQFPIDVLKIDQSFVQRISADSSNGIIVSAVIGMGASLMQRVIAEGVETQEQLLFLNKHHCDEGQGFLFSAPVAAAEFGKYVRKGVAALARLQ
jgi:EAL domain-containing protein (putative c-di-GMP-specific phosphodiesterase class I)